MHTSAQTPNAASGAAAPRTALAIGTVGRTGEALLIGLLENPDYEAVYVAVEAPLRSTLPRLRPWRIAPGALKDADRTDCAAVCMPPVDDVFCCIDGKRSCFRRDQAYCPVGAEQIPVLARIAAQSGARRLILLSPQSAFLQLSVPGNAAIQLREVALVALGFETLVILRPAQDYANAQGSALARLAAWGAKAVLEIVIPQRLQPLPAGQIAQAAIDAATLGPGVHILSGGQIAGLAAGAQRWRPAGTGSRIVV